VADIIDLQAERQKVAQARKILLDGTTGEEAEVEEATDAVHPSTEKLH
jgi:hypothetical protein